jgi:hypothetical protein
VVVRLEKDPCQGIAFRRAGKLGVSITRVSLLFDMPGSRGLKPFPFDIASARLKQCPDTDFFQDAPLPAANLVCPILLPFYRINSLLPEF